MRTALRGAAGLLIAALLLYWVFHGISPKDLWATLGHTSWTLLMAGALINLGHNAFRVLRWRWLLEPTRQNVPFRPMFAAVMVGYMTTLAGARVGELVRPTLLSAKENIPLGPTIGTIVADRLLDGLSIVALFAIGISRASFAPSAQPVADKIRGWAWLALVAVVAGLVFLTLLSGAAPRARRWLADRSPLVQWVGRAVLGLSEGASALRSLRRLVPIVLLSMATWTTIAIGTWMGVKAVGITVTLADVFVLLPLLAAGIALPTPGAAGGYHATMKFGLTTLFGVDPTLAASAGLMMHLAIAVPILILGLVLLKTEKISWADLVAAAKQVKAMGHAAPAGATP